MDPLKLLKKIETAHGVKLTGRLREFYESGEVMKYQNKYNKEFECNVDFFSKYALEADEEYEENLIPIAGKIDENGIEEEQAWIGVNLDKKDTPVYALYTSCEYEDAFKNFDEFLQDFE